MAHPHPRTQILLPLHMSMHPLLFVVVCVMQLVKPEGSAQTLAVTLVCARARLTILRAVNETRIVPENIFLNWHTVFIWGKIPGSISFYSPITYPASYPDPQWVR